MGLAPQLNANEAGWHPMLHLEQGLWSLRRKNNPAQDSREERRRQCSTPISTHRSSPKTKTGNLSDLSELKCVNFWTFLVLGWKGPRVLLFIRGTFYAYLLFALMKISVRSLVLIFIKLATRIYYLEYLQERSPHC